MGHAMDVLVTGARGFVGLNLVKTLAQRGVTVWAVDRSPVDRWVEAFLADESETVRHIQIDLSQSGALLNALPTSSLDAVVHAAVITATTADVERRHAREIVDVNVGGTIEALETAIATNTNRFVYVSSPSAIGDVESDGPVDESVVPRPTTLYGITKLSSEQIVERWRSLYGLNAVSVRIAQPYGPGERATAARVRTSPVWEWLRDARPGGTLPTGPLDRERDWTYVFDTAEGIARLALAERVPYGLYHLGTGEQVSVEEVFRLLREHIGDLAHDAEPDREVLNPNIAGPGRPPLDVTRFAGDFGWKPGTPFRVGMIQYVRWWSEFREIDGVTRQS